LKKEEKNTSRNREEKPKTRGKLRGWLSLKNADGSWRIGRIIIIGVLVALLLVTFAFGMVYNTGVGDQAILIDVSGAKFYGVANGAWSIKLPWQSLVVIHYSMHKLGFWGDGSDQYADFPAIYARSFDIIDHTVDCMVRWSYKPTALIEMYQNYQDMDMIKNDVIASTIRDAARDAVKEFTTVEINQKREIVAAKIEELIKSYIASKSSINFAVVPESIEFELRDIKAPADVVASFEKNLIAERDIVTALNERQAGIIRAETDAQKIIIDIQARANATIIQAQSVGEAVQILANLTGKDPADLIVLQMTLKGLQELANAQGKTYFFFGFQNGMPFLIPIEPDQ